MLLLIFLTPFSSYVTILVHYVLFLCLSWMDWGKGQVLTGAFHEVAFCRFYSVLWTVCWNVVIGAACLSEYPLQMSDFSVLADFNQVKPAWSERIKQHSNLASFASWLNTEKYSSLGNWILSFFGCLGVQCQLVTESRKFQYHDKNEGMT